MTYIGDDFRKRIYVWRQSVAFRQFSLPCFALNERHDVPHSKLNEINNVVFADCLKKAAAASLTLFTSSLATKKAVLLHMNLDIV